MKVKMGQFKLNKKAVSTLVVEVLLVAVVVSLGAMIIGWMNSYVNRTKDSADTVSYSQIMCQSDVDFSLWMRNSVSMVCYNSTLKEVKIYIDNRGKPIEKWFVRILNSTASDVFYENVSFDTGDVKLIILNYSKLNDFKEIDMFPLIEAPDHSIRMCKDKYLTLSKSKMSDCYYIAPYFS